MRALVRTPVGLSALAHILKVEFLEGDLLVTHKIAHGEFEGAKNVTRFEDGKWTRIEVIP